MAGGEDAAIEDGNKQKASLDVITAKEMNEGDRDDIDDADGSHGTDRAKGIDLSSLIDILCHGTT